MVTRCKFALGKFRQSLSLFSVLPSGAGDPRSDVPILCEERNAAYTRGMTHYYNRWDSLRHNGLAIIRWICNVETNDEVNSETLLTKLKIQDIWIN